MKRARGKTQKASPSQIKKTSKSSATNKLKKRKRFKIFAITFICAIAVVFIGLGLGTGGDNALIPIDTSTGKMNVLLLGTDKEGLRTDAIMIASYDFDKETLKLLSVPRDTKVYVTNRKVYRKINEVHAMTKKNGEIMGPLASIEAVSTITGIPINYYVEFSFDAIDHIMEILGPVSFNVPDVEGNGKGMNYDDPTQGLSIHLKPGLQELSGNQIQQFLRYRKSNGHIDDGSDTSRVARQQDFVKALLDQKINRSLIGKASDIYSQVKKEIKTNFSANKIAKYSTHLLKLTSENITTYSLPGQDKLTGAWYFECDLAGTKTLISTEFGYPADNLTNKMEITGEKFKPSKTSKADDSEDEKNNSNKTSTPKKTSVPKKTVKPSNDNDEQVATTKPTQKPTQKTTKAPDKKTEEPVDDEPQQTAEPTKKPTQKPEPPAKTPDPIRPTAKPTEKPSNNDTKEDVVVLEDE